MSEHPIIFSGPMIRAVLDGRKTMTRRVIKYEQFDWRVPPATSTECPYGQPGDKLWCKEGYYNGVGPGLADVSPGVHYRIDHPEVNAPWRSPLFMPQKYSRLTLEITAVRVKRVQDISIEDAIAEGFGDDYIKCGAVSRFIDGWNSINAKRGYGWDANPWVWVISFRSKP